VPAGVPLLLYSSLGDRQYSVGWGSAVKYNKPLNSLRLPGFLRPDLIRIVPAAVPSLLRRESLLVKYRKLPTLVKFVLPAGIFDTRMG
jgi:hypothetical protein